MSTQKYVNEHGVNKDALKPKPLAWLALPYLQRICIGKSKGYKNKVVETLKTISQSLFHRVITNKVARSSNFSKNLLISIFIVSR